MVEKDYNHPCGDSVNDRKSDSGGGHSKRGRMESEDSCRNETAGCHTLYDERINGLMAGMDPNGRNYVPGYRDDSGAA